MKAPTRAQLYDGAFTLNGFPFLEFDRCRDLSFGFGIGWNADLTLLQVMNDVHYRLNGYAIFRKSDVKRWRPILPDDFRARAAKLNRLRPLAPAGVSLCLDERSGVHRRRGFPFDYHSSRADGPQRLLCRPATADHSARSDNPGNLPASGLGDGIALSNQ